VDRLVAALNDATHAGPSGALRGTGPRRRSHRPRACSDCSWRWLFWPSSNRGAPLLANLAFVRGQCAGRI